jgi:hypothetical protein
VAQIFLRQLMNDMEELLSDLWDWHGTCLEGPRKNMENINLESRSSDWDLNPRSVEHEAEVLTTRPPYLVVNLILSRDKCFGLITRFTGHLYT